jgi:hypothetical protein
MIETTLFYGRESHLETPPLYVCDALVHTLTEFSDSVIATPQQTRP